MLDLNELSVFIRVVDEGSFTKAGKVLNMPKSRVSRMVADLEEKLQARLLHRTTRQLNLTEVGKAYYNGCRDLVKGIHETHEQITDREESPSGLLRVAAPALMSAGEGSGYLMQRYHEQYPDVRVEMYFYDSEINLIQQGFDIGFFIGDMPDSSLIARTLTEHSTLICASPEYLAVHGSPKHPSELATMNCVRPGEGDQDILYEFVHKTTGEKVSVKSQPVLVTNQFSTVLGFLKGAGGVAEIPLMVAAEDLLNGELVQVFEEWTLQPVKISIAYPTRHHVPSKVRTYVDFVSCFTEAVREQVDNTRFPDPEAAMRIHSQMANR